jgi:uncharacterized protein YbjQ (UPF0145 family)
MIVVTTDEVPGRKVVRTLGLVRGNSVRARHVGRDIIAGLKNIIGGEVHEYTKLLAESREQALDRMVNEAQGMRANAVVGSRFVTSQIANGVAELLAYGTAVILEDEQR